MKRLIKKLLKEVMISSLDKWKENLHSLNDATTNSIVTLISKDDETGDKLFLFVAFKNYGETSEFSYSFIHLLNCLWFPTLNPNLTNHSSVRGMAYKIYFNSSSLISFEVTLITSIISSPFSKFELG